MMIGTVGVVGRHNDTSAALCDVLTRLIREVTQRGCYAYIESETAKNHGSLLQMNNVVCASFDSICRQADLIISVGGDGTMLGCLRQTVGREIPVVGVSMGTLGFLTDVSPTDIETAMDNILDGDYVVDRRMMLSGPGGNIAANDVVIRQPDHRMIHYSITLNGKHLTSAKSDALIISTPTGSTAYAMSAGGVIMMPDCSNVQIVHVAPHTLSARNIVVGLNRSSEIDVVVHNAGSNGFDVVYDGIVQKTIGTNSVSVVKSDSDAVILRSKSYSFTDVMTKKFFWMQTSAS